MLITAEYRNLEKRNLEAILISKVRATGILRKNDDNLELNLKNSNLKK
jgi:hypothetical protein